MHSLSQVILVIGVVVILNILLSAVSLRLDLTEAKIYTLSKSTKNILRGLENPVTFKLYFSAPEELPEYLITVRRDTLDILREYKKAGKGKVILETYNPQKDIQIAREAARFGVPEIEFQKVGPKELKITRGYGGLAMVYRTEVQPIPYIQNINNLEYEITAGILRITENRIPAIAIVKGHGEEISEEMLEKFRTEFTIEDINLESLNVVPKRFDAMIISGPTKVFTEHEKYVIDQFVMRGGKLFLLLNGVNVENNSLTAYPSDSGLNSLLETYGVRVNSDIVLDPSSNATLPFRTDLYTVFLRYPPYPRVTGTGLNRESIITERIQELLFPFPSSITKTSAESTNREIIELVKSSPNSYTVEGNGANLLPNALGNLLQKMQGPQILAALVRGETESYFQGKSIPERVESPGEDPGSIPEFLPRTGNGAIFIAGTSRAFLNDGLARSPENFILLANALGVLARNESLVDIRSRGAANRPLKDITEKQAINIKYANILSGALLSVIVGLAAYFFRRRSSRRAYLKYG